MGGYSLFEGALVDMRNPPDMLFLHSRKGAQGLAPVAKHWRAFQDWYHLKINDTTFHPYIKDDTTITRWRKSFEKAHTENRNWAIWWGRYCDDHNLWHMYPNIAAHAKATGRKDSNGKYFAYHRQENGLHFSGQKRSNKGHLIDSWHSYFTEWPAKVKKYYYQGQNKGDI